MLLTAFLETIQRHDLAKFVPEKKQIGMDTRRGAGLPPER